MCKALNSDPSTAKQNPTKIQNASSISPFVGGGPNPSSVLETILCLFGPVPIEPENFVGLFADLGIPSLQLFPCWFSCLTLQPLGDPFPCSSSQKDVFLESFSSSLHLLHSLTGNHCLGRAAGRMLSFPKFSFTTTV